MNREIHVVVSKVGDGNPFYAHGLADSLEGTITELDGITQLISFWHQWMTAYKSKEYSNNSEAVRSSSLAQLAAAFLGLEVRYNYPKTKSNRVGIFVQEHSLMNLSCDELNQRFPGGIYLAIPDVYPKHSAREIASRKNAALLVWNHDAYDQEIQYHHNTILIEPNLYTSFTGGGENFKHQGVPLVLKTSGSGMPKSWLSHMNRVLTTTSLNYQLFVPGSVIMPERKITLPSNISRRAAKFFDSLGAHTRVFCTYPNEEIQVTAEMYQLGWDGNCLAYPFRGQHEENNFRFAREHGFIQGIINEDNGYQIARTYGLPCIDVEEIPDIVKTPLTVRPDLSVLGTTDINEVVHISRN